jgi:uncharacterized cupin superfamily protein
LPPSPELCIVRLQQRSNLAPQVYYVSKEKLITGNPKQAVWIEYESPDREFFAGIWASEVGEWKVQYTEQEYCYILEGINVLTDENGNSQEFSAGMEFIVPRGFVGTWRVVEPTRKRFVIHEKAKPPSPPERSDA